MFDSLRSVFSKVVEALATAKLTDRSLESLLDDLFIKLVECDVAVDVAEAIAEELRGRLYGARAPRFGEGREKALRSLIKQALLSLLEGVPDVDFVSMAEEGARSKRPYVMVFLGPNGYGKTTTIAKIAHIFVRRGYSVLLAASDTFRAGAIEQLEEHGRRLGVKVLRHKYGADPAAVAYDAVQHAKSKGIHFVMIDTAGRMHTDVNLMNELAKIQRVVQPDNSIFVADALLGNEALEIAKYYAKFVRIDGLVVAKADAYAKGGAILTFLYALRKPIYFLGVGQKYEDLVPFRKEQFIDLLVG